MVVEFVVSSDSCGGDSEEVCDPVVGRSVPAGGIVQPLLGGFDKRGVCLFSEWDYGQIEYACSHFKKPYILWHTWMLHSIPSDCDGLVFALDGVLDYRKAWSFPSDPIVDDSVFSLWSNVKRLMVVSTPLHIYAPSPVFGFRRAVLVPSLPRFFIVPFWCVLPTYVSGPRVSFYEVVRDMREGDDNCLVFRSYESLEKDL